VEKVEEEEWTACLLLEVRGGRIEKVACISVSTNVGVTASGCSCVTVEEE
jgi:hypothetical protein